MPEGGGVVARCTATQWGQHRGEEKQRQEARWCGRNTEKETWKTKKPKERNTTNNKHKHHTKNNNNRQTTRAAQPQLRRRIWEGQRLPSRIVSASPHDWARRQRRISKPRPKLIRPQDEGGAPTSQPSKLQRITPQQTAAILQTLADDNRRERDKHTSLDSAGSDRRWLWRLSARSPREEWFSFLGQSGEFIDSRRVFFGLLFFGQIGLLYLTCPQTFWSRGPTWSLNMVNKDKGKCGIVCLLFVFCRGLMV